MRFNSPQLQRAMQITRLGEFGPEDGVVEIPSSINSILQIPVHVGRVAGLGLTDNQAQSFYWESSISRAASQAEAFETRGQYVAGLWEIFLTLSHFADFTGAVTAVGARILMLDPDGTQRILLGSFPVVNVPQHQQRKFQILFPEDGWNLRTVIGATGVGQTQALLASGLSNRLL